LPSGKEVKGRLSTITTPYTEKEKVIDKNNSQPWKRKPAISVEAYQIETTYGGLGLSGAPVWEPNRGKIVGMFAAVAGMDPSRDLSTVGYVIPIEEILEKLQEERKLANPSITLDTASIINEGNMYSKTGDFYKALEYYEKVIYDPNHAIAWYNKGKIFL
jgi:tetratricopeptide (TPR) repeat protein